MMRSEIFPPDNPEDIIKIAIGGNEKVIVRRSEDNSPSKQAGRPDCIPTASTPPDCSPQLEPLNTIENKLILGEPNAHDTHWLLSRANSRKKKF